MDYLYWTVAILLLLAGLLGSVVPLLPGTTLIVLGVLWQKWLLPGTLGWAAVAWVAVFWLLSIIVDIACTLLGTRLFGGGKWGMAGATGGALAGMLFSLPALLLGSMFGAVAAEKWLGKRSTEDSFKAGAGAAVGFLMGTVARGGCAVIMVTIYVIAVVNAWPARS